MPNPGGQFFSDEFGDIEDYFISDYQLIDQYIGDTLWNWGQQAQGQLGVNDTTQRNTPVTTLIGGVNWETDSSGLYHKVVIKTDGTLWCWGRNDFGQVGINTTINRSTPVTTLSGGTNWKTVSGGGFHNAAIKTDGSLWTWGRNTAGQLGDNSIVTRSTPVTTLSGGTNWKSISCGKFHTISIKTDGSLWTWGSNAYGQLGVNDTTNRNTPVTTLTGGTNWKSISAGGYHTVATKTDGSLWVWGRNNNGQLGINNTITRSTPVTTILGGSYWKSTACGYFYTVALKTDGSLWSWGQNNNGQLGINDTTTRSTPVTTLIGGTNWKSISCGYYHTSTIKTDGSLWTWGRNAGGQLGINDTTTRSTPVTTLLGGNNWKSTSCGYQHTSALTAGQSVDFS